MTANGQQSSDRPWQTLAAGLLLIASTVILGRWWAGARFGYVIFATVWGPITAGHLAAGHGRRFGMGITGAVAVLISFPLLTSWPLPTAARLAGMILILIGSVCFLAIAMSRWFGRSLSVAIVTLAWLTWLIVPLTTLPGMASESWLVFIYRSHPIVALNRLDSTAADWTHQSIAYRWLTRLGQDVPYEWPESVWLCIGTHLGTAIVASSLTGRRVVPRGTTL